jgi:ribosomal-protein-alanine N-acetyltransferase
LTEITYRLAKAVEASPIAVLSRDLVESGLGWSWTVTRVVQSIKSPRNNVLIAEQCTNSGSNSGSNPGSNLAGFGIMEYGNETAYLNLLAVKPRWQRHGIGRDMVNWMEQSALTAGITIVYLQCRANNTAAQAFYRKLGYKKLQTLPDYYRGIESAVLMGRDLTIAVSPVGL